MISTRLVVTKALRMDGGIHWDIKRDRWQLTEHHLFACFVGLKLSQSVDSSSTGCRRRDLSWDKWTSGRWTALTVRCRTKLLPLVDNACQAHFFQKWVNLPKINNISKILAARANAKTAKESLPIALTMVCCNWR